MPATQGNLVKPDDITTLMDTIQKGVAIALASPNKGSKCASLTAWTWTKPSTGALAVDTLITNAQTAYTNSYNVVHTACSGDNSTVNSTQKSGNNSSKYGTNKSGKTTGYDNSVKNGTVYSTFCNPDT